MSIHLEIHSHKDAESVDKTVFPKYPGLFNNQLLFDERKPYCWTKIVGELKKIKPKYEGYTTYKLPRAPHLQNIIPCHALLATTVETEEVREAQYIWGYPTFQAFTPGSNNQTPLDDFEENFAKMPDIKWIQLGKRPDYVILQLKLSKNSLTYPITPWAIKNDTTGEFYGYIVDRAICHVKNL